MAVSEAPQCGCVVFACVKIFSYPGLFFVTRTGHKYHIEQDNNGGRGQTRRSVERNGSSKMPDYGDILRFLAQTPPQSDAERQMHASLLELIAECLRSDDTQALAEARQVRDCFPDRSMALRLS